MIKTIDVLGGRYRIVKKLSRSHQRNVYLSEHIKLNTFWVIKESLVDSDLKREACILKRLNHPFIPRVIDYFNEAKYSYLVEDYIDGESLKEIMGNNRIDIVEALKIIYRLCKILDYLHHIKPYPIIHCDIKPSNVIKGNDGSIRLVDFGASTFIEEQWMKPSGGTIGYAAPEQYGFDTVGVETDIFALGVLLYHMMVGKLPQKPAIELCYDQDIPLEVVSLIKKCTKTQKSLRYSNVKKLGEAVLSVIQLIYEKKIPSLNRKSLQI